MSEFTFERLKVENGSIYTESGKPVAKMDRSEEATKVGISPVERDCNAHRFVFLWNQAFDAIDPSIKRVRKVCAKCGSAEVKIDAFAYWNVSTQQWDETVTFPTWHCNKCDGETTVRDEPLDGVWSKMLLDALGTDILDEMVHNLKGEEASVINNAGKKVQIEYLLGGE